MNFRYPIFLNLTDKKCLVTGAGYEIAAKVRGLVQARADVTYVNPSAEESIQALASAGAIHWERRDFEPRDLAGCFLVITDRDENAEIFRMAEEQKALCNSVDDPGNCRFSFGSLHRQGDLTIAVSTNGQAPAVAVRLREKFQREIGPEYAALLAILRVFRPIITASVPEFADRRKLWYRIVDSNVLQLIRRGHMEHAVEAIARMLDEAAR